MSQLAPKNEQSHKEKQAHTKLNPKQKQLLEKITEPNLNPAQLMLCAKEIEFLSDKEAAELFRHIPGTHCLLLYLFLGAHQEACRVTFLTEMSKKMAVNEQRELRDELIGKAKSLLDPVNQEAGIRSFEKEIKLGTRYLELADGVQQLLKQFHPNEKGESDELMLYALEGYKLIAELYSKQR